MQVTGSVIKSIKTALPALPLEENVPMSAHTSFRIGGPARAMAFPASIDETAEVVRLLRSMDVAPFIMGNGTNLLVRDEPLDIFVLKMDEGMAAITPEGENSLRCGAGAPLARIAQKAQSLGLAGFEFAGGIPGTLGGAVSMNAGAYGGEMRDVVREAVYVDEKGDIRTRRGAELDLSYRHSAFSDTGDIILEATLALTPGDGADILARMRELSDKRRSSQPLDVPSAGSTFKRPVGGYAAALIDSAGLKGYSIGGAQVSEKHAGFVINRGGASFQDVIDLMEHIKKTVYETSGVALEAEVKIIR